MAFTWDANLRRYRNAAGHLVSETAIRELIAALGDSARRRTARLTTQYLDGDLPIAEWRTEMRGVLRSAHSASAAVARGGWSQMSRSDWGWTGARVKAQYKRLDRFKSDLVEHKAKVEAGEAEGPGNNVQRAAMYGESGKVSYHGMNRRVHRAAGATEARRRRGAGKDSCDTCIREHNRGWVAIEDVKPIGDSECITHCGCHIEYR